MMIQKRLENLIKALEFEKEHEISAYKSIIELKTIQEKIKSGKTLFPIGFLNVKYSRFGDTILEFSIHDKQSLAGFNTGTLIELFNQEEEKEVGVVFGVTDGIVSIQINFSNIEEWVKKGKVGLNKLPDTKTHDLYLNALKSIKDSDFTYNIKQIYTGTITILESEEMFNDSGLNESQNKAVSQILNENIKVTIIHGPPGTGKTTTIIQSIVELIKDKKKIIICAPTNTAVDHICQKLMAKNVKCCRIGNPAKIDSIVQDITLDGLAEKDSSFKIVEQLKKQLNSVRKKAFKYKRNFGKDEFDERKRLKSELKLLKKDIRKMQKDMYLHIFENSDVICGTFVGVLTENFKGVEFDYVIVDEAAQAIEPAIWSVSQLASNLVLAGDNFQLPPFVQSNKAIVLGLNKSILEMVMELNFPTQLLNVQYRMNHKIMSYSNTYFYNEKLMAFKTNEFWTVENDIFEPIEFIDTAGCGFEEEKNEISYGVFNPGEVMVLKNRLNELNTDSNSIGIISPYRLQVNEIQNELQSLNKQINTIDSFQGQERDIILISLVRSNTQSEIGFLKDYRRMNVAMTRAKKKLIIIGDSSTIGQDSFYAGLLDFVEKSGSYRSAWEYMT